MFETKHHKVIRTDPAKRVLMDVISNPRPPDGHVLIPVDMSAAQEFCRRYRRTHRVPLTYLHLMIKASAVMLKTFPSANYMLDGYKIVVPDSIDIGVSVAGEETVTPVVVIRNADQKSLGEIVQEFKQKKRQALAAEQENLRKLRQAARWLPVGWIRRHIIRYLANRHFVRRRLIGTFQITTLNVEDVEAHITNHLGTAANLSTGTVVKKPIVVDDKIEIRPTLYTCWQADARVLLVRDSVQAPRLFKWLIEHPSELDDRGTVSTKYPWQPE